MGTRPSQFVNEDDPSRGVDRGPGPDSADAAERRVRPSTAHPAAAVGSDFPRRLGRFNLLRQLARGGMGQVYLAASGSIEGAETPVVVKTIRQDRIEDASFVARFLDEARVQSQLHHPTIPAVFEASIDASGVPYVAMEYVPGRSLAEISARAISLRRRLEWPDVVTLGVALSEALAYVHSRTDLQGAPLGIVHRDLSPQNVMVSFGGELKLIDFGTARGRNRRSQTVSGVVLAKPGYVAPEVGECDAKPASTRADLYAFGVILWEMLAGRRFLRGDPVQHLQAVRSGERSLPPIAWELGAPPELDVVLGRLGARDPAERYSHAGAALSTLAELLREAPPLAGGARSIRRRLGELLRELFPGAVAKGRNEFESLLRQRQVEVTPPPPAEPTPPRMLSGTRYELGPELGHGATAVVFEGRHVDLHRTVALKVLSPEFTNDEAAVERFRAEARVLAAFRNRHLAELYDCGMTTDGRLFLAMEKLNGATLEDLTKPTHVLPWQKAAEIAIQTCHALEAAHAAGFIHRDVKPSNLFVTNDGQLKLLDFGIAKRIDGVTALFEQDERVFGTPEYMAPEQATRERIDERADIYSLGAVIYELVTGRLPHRAGSPLALFAAKTSEKVIPAGKMVMLPRRLDDAISRALSRDPAQRFLSCQDFRNVLEAALRKDRASRKSWAFGLGSLFTAREAQG